MERYEQLYELYDGFDTETLRAYQSFVDVFPPVDSRFALEQWADATDELTARKDEIRDGFPAVGETLADVAAHANRDQAFTALDLLSEYGRGINVLVLDIDETLRSAGRTDNEIPRETLHLLTEFYENGIPIVVCTGQTLENVKGFMIQGLGNEIVYSGRVSIVYEAGTGVFTPGNGPDTKQLLYESLDEDITGVFERLRSRILSDAPDDLRRNTHRQGNEFNVTLKPNFETGSDRGREVIDDALVFLLDLLCDVTTDAAGVDGEGEDDDSDDGDDADETRDGHDAHDAIDSRGWARTYYAANDTEIRGVLERRGVVPDLDPDAMPEALLDLFKRIDVAYYQADAAEVGSLELNKVVGVEAALDVLGINDPFALVMGDSKSDLRVMRWVHENGTGMAAAPEHASRDVLDHVVGTDELVFDRGEAAEPLRVAYALNRLAALE